MPRSAQSLSLFTGLSVLLLAGAGRGADAPKQRIVFLGDSITDGHTLPLLVQQALVEAGKTAPVCINAGLAGDTAHGMGQRLDRDVLVHRPTLVCLSAGINDVLHGVKPAAYEADVKAIADRLRTQHIRLVFLTTTTLGPRHAAADRKLADYNAILHRLAQKYGYQVAEVNRRLQAARTGGRKLLEEDQVHLTFAGYRLLTAAVLEGLGYQDVPVQKELKLSVMPGILREWHIRPTPKSAPPLSERTVHDLKPDASRKLYRLPETKPMAHWWMDQERRRGFAVALDKLVGPASSYQGVAQLRSKKPRRVFFNTGAQLQSIWLNGKQIYHSQGWTGWHAGKERIAARLQEGTNTIVIETGAAFFLGVTDGNTW